MALKTDAGCAAYLCQISTPSDASSLHSSILDRPTNRTTYRFDGLEEGDHWSRYEILEAIDRLEKHERRLDRKAYDDWRRTAIIVENFS